MKVFKNIVLSAALLSVFVLVGCKEDDPAPSAKELLQEALTTTSWTIDPANSDVSGVTGKPDISNTTISFSETEAGVSFSLGGDIGAYLTGGALDIADDGTTSNLAINTSADIVVMDSNLTEASEEKVRMTVTTGKASGRMEGVGSYTLTFNAN